VPATPDLLRRPAFWAVHLGLALGHDLGDDLAALFGVPRGLIRGTYLRVTDTPGFPQFDISTPAGAVLTVTYDHTETTYALTPPHAAPITIGAADAVPDGPALSWPEWQALAAHRPHTRLLLAPLLGDDSAPEAATHLDAALRAAQIPGHTSEIAAALAAAQPTTWRADNGVRLCDHPGSTRNPAGNRTLPPAAQAAVSQLLTP
jgi:hypothetical protein